MKVFENLFHNNYRTKKKTLWITVSTLGLRHYENRP